MLVLAGCDDVWSIDHVSDYTPPQDAFDPGIAGLVAWYPLDSADGGVSVESSHGLHARCVGSRCPSTVEGVIGGALQFDGVDDVLIVDPDPLLMTTQGFTVATWVRLDVNNSGELCVANKQHGSAQYQNTFQMCVQNLEAEFYSWNGSMGHEQKVPNALQVGVWVHLALRWDGTMKTLVVNGISSPPSAVTIAFDASPISIGADVDATVVAPWPGAIDDLRIYDRALDLGEIATLASP